MKMKIYLLTSMVILVNHFSYAQFTRNNTAAQPTLNLQMEEAKKLIQQKSTQLKLGSPHAETPEVKPTAVRGGYYQRFNSGWLYYNPKMKAAFFTSGEITVKWGELGYESGIMGFPAGDLVNTPNRTGKFQVFDNGTLYFSPTTGAHFIRGEIRNEWLKRGAENSAMLGFPKTDELEIFENGYTRYQQFEKGSLFFSLSEGVAFVNNPNQTQAPDLGSQFRTVEIEVTSIYGSESGVTIENTLELYGWFDLRVYVKKDQEVRDIEGRSHSIFNIEEKRYATIGYSDGITPSLQGRDFHRKYKLRTEDIEQGAFIRAIGWLNDVDDDSSNDYLGMQNSSGKVNYNGGNHRYHDQLLKPLLAKVSDSVTYAFVEGSDNVIIKIKITVTK
ncbi:MAG: hypothetical protein K2P88_03845 [Chitinophagaceae bacterium]|uniref:LGFP repeat-containing protein n=1 Tax=unclassified Paraflavitalea TaxID=2798305 RepID=UPI003D32C0D5|nr:hypothetical protein [Chitinophagaceae bacterium]